MSLLAIRYRPNQVAAYCLLSGTSADDLYRLGKKYETYCCDLLKFLDVPPSQTDPLGDGGQAVVDCSHKNAYAAVDAFRTQEN